MKRLALVAPFLALGVSSGQAQTSPPDRSVELVKPPELRGTPSVARPDTLARKTKRAVTHSANGHGAVAAAPTDGPRAAAPASDHPIGFGIAVHGGAGDPQHYTATGAVTPGEETGTGVAARLKFGF